MAEAIQWILVALGVVFTIAVPLALFGLRLSEGLWGNTICCSNITFASLIAFNYYDPVALLLVDAYAGGQLLYDFLSFWLLFSLAFFLLNLITNKLSQVKVHFPKTVEQAGNGTLLFLIFFNFVSIIFFTLPMAPFKFDETPLQFGGDARQIEESRSEFFGRKARILSTGTLVPFTGENIWDDPPNYVSRQINKRGLLYVTMVENSDSMLCSEQVQHSGGGSGAE